tara:strand:- start:19 stop:1173 length:1155 start_codon:yes stop_codon:yes gene_type:complete
LLTLIKRAKKMKKQQLIFIFLSIFISVSSFAQVLISDKEDKEVLNSNSSAILQLNSSEKGFLMPRMTNSKREAIKAPAPGLQVYVTDFNDGKGAALFFNGKKWIVLTQQVTLPDPPTDVEATFTGERSENSEVKVTFRAPENNGGSTITKYEITSYSSGGKEILRTVNSTGDEDYTETFAKDLINNFYNFRVKAKNIMGYSISSESSNIVPNPIVGSPVYGGRVFYILNSKDPGYIEGKTRGLICANRDHKSGSEEKWKWSPIIEGGFPEVTKTKSEMGWCRINTTEIIKKLGEVDKRYAAYQATLYKHHDDDDFQGWYLPSHHELKKIHDKLYSNYSMNFSIENYWSSSERGKTHASFYDLNNGKVATKTKSDKIRVRPVRFF